MADYEVTSVYLGGGIATYIKAERLCSIVDALRASFALAPDVEITMRALLGYVDEFKLRDCQKAGISKIDVDYHFWDPHAVRFTGRQALPEQSMATVRAFAHYGYADVSYELFYGIPGQSQEHWVAELERVLGFEPAHLVLMPMRVPPGSVLEHELANLHAAYGDRSQYRMPDAQALACMLEHAQYVLADRGYEEYLSGAFCLPGHRRKYLLDEAAGVECLSLGCGGISCVDGVCSRTTSDIERYTQHPGDLGAIIEDVWVAG